MRTEFTTRAVVFAFLFGPPRFIDHEEAMEVYRRLCRELRSPDLSFRYEPPATLPGPQQKMKPFKVSFHRAEGRGSFNAEIEYSDKPGGIHPGAIRLLMNYGWPQSPALAEEMFDITSSSLFDSTVPHRWTKVHAEARLRLQFQAPGGDALGYFRSSVLGLGDQFVAAMGGDLMHCAIQLEAGSTRHSEDPLEGPTRTFDLQVLRDDSRSLYVESVSSWSQLPAPVGSQGLPSAVDVSRVRPIDRNPSAYIKDAYTFVAQRIDDLPEVRTR